MKKISENDQLTGHFQSFFVLFCVSFSEFLFFIFFLISAEQTVKRVK